jgi:hypothetical protein
VAEVKQVARRLIYAAADQDMGQVLDALRGFHPSGNVRLVLALADTAAAALQELHGEGWRDALNLAMLAASVEEVPGGAADAG